MSGGGKPENWQPQLGGRVPQEMKDAVLALAPYLGGVEEANQSVILRELLTIALTVVAPEFIARATPLARRHGWDRPTVWRAVVEAGLAALEREVAMREEGGSDGG